MKLCSKCGVYKISTLKGVKGEILYRWKSSNLTGTLYDLHIFCWRSYRNLHVCRLTFVLKFILCSVSQYRHANVLCVHINLDDPPLKYDLPLWAWSWLCLFKVIQYFRLTFAFKFVLHVLGGSSQIMLSLCNLATGTIFSGFLILLYRDFSSPFLGPNFSPIPNAKMANIFPKNWLKIPNLDPPPKKIVKLHLKQWIYWLFYENYNRRCFKAVKPQLLTV